MESVSVYIFNSTVNTPPENLYYRYELKCTENGYRMGWLAALKAVDALLYSSESSDISLISNADFQKLQEAADENC